MVGTLSAVAAIFTPETPRALTYSDTLVTVQLLPGDTSLASAIAVASSCPFLSVEGDPRRVSSTIFEYTLEPDATLDSVQQDLLGTVRMVNPVIELPDGQRAWFADRLTAKFKADVSVEVLDSLKSALGCWRETPEADVFGFNSIRTDSSVGLSIIEICEQFASSGVCSVVVPQILCRFNPRDEIDPCHSAPYDRADLQWALDNRGQSGGTPGVDINAPHAWRATRGNPKVIVAVIDNSFDWYEVSTALHYDIDIYDTTLIGPFGHDPVGADPETPAFDENPMVSAFCGHPNSDLEPPERMFCAHGTMCLGILAGAHNGDAIDGIAPRCTYYALKAAGDNGFGSDTSLATTLYYALSVGADIVSISIGPDENFAPSFVISNRAFQMLKDSGVAVFVAAGNKGAQVEYPADLESVYAVGATDHDDELFSYSARDSTIDFVAPSGPLDAYDSPSCTSPGSIVTWDLMGNRGVSPSCDTTSECKIDSGVVCGVGGTSLAAPVAAGVAALILSLRPDLLELPDPGQAVIDIMKESCVDLGEEGFDTLYGWGRVDAGRALAIAAKPNDPYPDGVHSILDVIEVINVAFRGRNCFPLYYDAGDLNCDGVIDVMDVSRMISVAVRGISPVSAGFVPCKEDLSGPACCPPPLLLSPAHDSTNLPQFFTADWPDCYWAGSYVFELDTSRAFSEPLISDTVDEGSCYSVSNLSQNTRYYWRVLASGADCPGRVQCNLDIHNRTLIADIHRYTQFGDG